MINVKSVVRSAMTLLLLSGVARAAGVANDFDGDGKADLAVYRDGEWAIFSLTKGIILPPTGTWGGADYIVVK